MNINISKEKVEKKPNTIYFAVLSISKYRPGDATISKSHSAIITLQYYISKTKHIFFLSKNDKELEKSAVGIY